MKKKKITSVFFTSAITVSMLFSMAACGANEPSETNNPDAVVSDETKVTDAEPDEPSPQNNISEDSASEAPSEEPAVSAAPEAPSEETTVSAAPEVQVEAGTALEYKMAYYFDESVASNEADVIKKVVQNLSNGYETITDEALLKEEDTYQLFWAAETGATLTIPLEIPADGLYDISVCLHKGGDFGTHQFFIGETLINPSEDIDLYSEEGGLADFDLGEVELAAGNTELLIRCTGQNGASAGSVFGISTMTLTCREVFE